jgi:hypothetical protein
VPDVVPSDSAIDDERRSVAGFKGSKSFETKCASLRCDPLRTRLPEP